MTDTNELHLDRATIDDAQRVSSWVSNATEALTFAGLTLGYPFTGEAFLQSAGDRWNTYVLRDNQTAVATGAIEYRGDGEARLGRVLVDPAQRGEGFGRVMLHRLIAQATQHATIDRLTLSVFETNRAARKLYASLGFIDTGQRVSITTGQAVLTGLELSLAV